MPKVAENARALKKKAGRFGAVELHVPNRTL